MDREVNLDSIRALEEQIEEHERAIIRLKRKRNSLLNVSTFLPPEILGKVFRWNVIPDGDFGGPSKGSYNFVLVCHHWFEVASRTPELWRSWGNSIQDWAHRCAHHGNVPLDLALGWHSDRDLDDGLRDALRDRAARDTIRQIHLRNSDAKLLNSVISSIVTREEETRSSSMESFVLQNIGHSTVDISDFFARHRLPKLKYLHLSGCTISSWGLLKSKTTALTTLDLTPSNMSPPPTVSQLLSILSSNPLLQNLVLSPSSVPHIVDIDKSSPRVSLRHLKVLDLTSNFCHVFGLLNQLEIPDKMDSLKLYLFGCSPLDISQTVGPYLGDHVRRRGRFPGGLGLSADRGLGVRFRVGDAHKGGDSAGVVWFVTVKAAISATVGEVDIEKMCFDLIPQIPLEEVVNLRTTLPILRSEELCVEMCNLVHLCLSDIDMSTFFVEPDVPKSHAHKDLLRSLNSISIIQPILNGGDWGPLMDFLTRRAAVGKQISSFRIDGFPRIDTSMIERISCVVEDFGDVKRDEYDYDGY